MANMEITLTVSQDVARYVRVGEDGEPDLRGRARACDAPLPRHRRHDYLTRPRGGTSRNPKVGFD